MEVHTDMNMAVDLDVKPQFKQNNTVKAFDQTLNLFTTAGLQSINRCFYINSEKDPQLVLEM